jgi:UPF0755 protein
MTRSGKNTAGQLLMKSDKNLIKRLLVLFIVILFITGGIWVWFTDGISAPDPQDNTPVIFIIQKGEGVKSIASRLSQQSLIRSPTAFYILIKVNRIERQLQAGDFRLSRSMDAQTISRELTHGIHDVWVTTLEGWRDEEIAVKLTKDLDIPESEFLKVAREGYMFPDTYQIPREATVGAIVELFSDTFNRKITPVINSEVTNNGLSFEEIIILASIVEREGKNNTDRPVIAGILLNRLRDKQPLQADATLQYALGYQMFEKTWWKKNISEEDKALKSPYNTYIYSGLPPAPICNPGLESVTAVIHPKKTDYFYYLHDPAGQIHYAVTLEEHNVNITKYLQ